MAAKAGFQAVTAVISEGLSAEQAIVSGSAAEESFHSQCAQEGRQNPLDRRCAGLTTCTALNSGTRTFHNSTASGLSFELNPRAMSFPLQSLRANEIEVPPTIAKGDDTNGDAEDKVLCHLPDCFYFGSMAFPTGRGNAALENALPVRTFQYGL
mmetsp:Transcript_51714/g.123890  ORF Transcript_51714/g.123890 Transcript_51714/m.123890 type:complete len:154 (-) Transcript_51714:57-518(-)